MDNKKKKLLKVPGFYLILFVIILVLVMQLDGLSGGPEKIDYQEILEKVEANEVEAIAVIGYEVFGLEKGSAYTLEQFPQKADFTTEVLDFARFDADLRIIEAKKLGVEAELITPEQFSFKYQPERPKEMPWWVANLAMLLITFVAIGVIWFVMSQQAQGGGGGKVMSFGKSRAKMQTDTSKKKTFGDVAGADEEKHELQEIVEFLKNPKKFLDLGARIPKGVLLVGPPGTGKTLLAKASAGEAGVPFFSISGSDFVEMFVGVGASRVRDMFEQAKKNSPCIVFIDEIDAVGRQRGTGLGGGHDEREQTLNQLLVEMDGFNVNEGIIIIAATNRADILDPALLRPGRFDRQIRVGIPDVKGREEILQIHAKGKPLSDEINLKTLAKRTPGFTGADLENMMNEAAILTARRDGKKVKMVDMEEAITRVIAGPEKKSRVITEKDKKITAYHEAGHAVVSHLIPGADPVHEVSIIPRGMAAGYTLNLPVEDKNHVTKSDLETRIAILLAGRIAEDITFGDISAGASNDIQRATQIARQMVTQLGMSTKLGPINFGGSHEEIFIGRDWGSQKEYSEKVAAEIDSEIHAFIQAGYDKAEELLKTNSKQLEDVSQALLEHEKLDAEEFITVFDTGHLEVKEEEVEETETITEPEEVKVEETTDEIAETEEITKDEK